MGTTDRLRSAADIRRTVGHRCAAGCDWAVVHVRAREDAAPARAAVVAGRRVGGAVQRNRAKRRLRAILTALQLPDGVDLVVTAKHGADSVPFGDLERSVAGCVRRALGRLGRNAPGAQTAAMRG